MRAHVHEAAWPPNDEREVEIVERKGIGHPDTICDAVMEQVSRALCAAYRERFGTILHHNCDKGLLVAGHAVHRFGGGEILQPMRLYYGDRASFGVGDRRIDVGGIAVEAARRWIRENLPLVDPSRHVEHRVELREGSEQLVGLFCRDRTTTPLANDTSAAVGYAPLTETERLILETERYLNSPGFKSRFPETGHDVKVLGARTGRRLELTVAMPLIDARIGGVGDYFDRKEAIVADLESHLEPRLERIDELAVAMNALDRRDGGVSGVYLSVIGTSAESADSGQVGRGNQVNGLIALQRPRGAEATAGKNPVSHVGKIYSVLAHRLARRLVEEVRGLRSVEIWLQSRIGEPVASPHVIAIAARPEPGRRLVELEPPIQALVAAELERMPTFCEELARGLHPVC